MVKKAGLEIRADLNIFRKELKEANAELRKLNQTALNSASALKPLEQQGKKTAGIFGELSQFWGNFSKQIIGANVFSRAVGFMKSWGQSIIQASSSLTELNSKAEVVFGDAFPRMQGQVGAIAAEVGRSSSAVLQFATDIGAVIKAFDITGPLMENMSAQLAKLAVDMASFHNVSDGEAFMALRSGLTGETEPLKRFGIVLTDVNLKLFAQEKGITKSFSAMNQAQKTVLRYEYIMAKTADAQGDAARTADSFANQTRRLQGEIQNLNEEAGRFATPVLAEGIGMVAQSFQQVRLFVQALTRDIGSLITMMGAIPGIGVVKKAASSALKSSILAPILKGAELTKNVFGIVDSRLQEDKAAESKVELDEKINALADFDALGGGLTGSGGGKSAAEQREAIEKKLIDALGEQAKLALENLQKRREELLLRQKLGILTKAESKELDTINRRLEFKDEMLDELVDKWEDVGSKIEASSDKLKDLREQVRGLGKDLDNSLKTVDEDTADAKAEKVVDLLREREELEKKLAKEGGLSQEDFARLDEITNITGGLTGSGPSAAQEKKRALEAEKKQIEAFLKANPHLKETSDTPSLSAADKYRRLREIDESLSNMGDPSSDIAAVEEGKKRFNQRQGESELDTISREGEEKKADLIEEENEKRRELLSLIDQERQKLDDLKAQHADIENQIINGLDSRLIESTARYKLLEEETKRHADAMEKEFNRIYAASRKAATGSVTAPKMATGGPVVGPGGPTDDKVLRWLSNGEYVVNARSTQLYRPIIDKINAMTLSVPKMATGGPVSSTDSHDHHISVTQNLHGDAARHAPDPRMIRWTLRKYN